MWLIAYRHHTTSRRMGPRWPYHQHEDRSYAVRETDVDAISVVSYTRMAGWLKFAADHPTRIAAFQHSYEVSGRLVLAQSQRIVTRAIWAGMGRK